MGVRMQQDYLHTPSVFLPALPGGSGWSPISAIWLGCQAPQGWWLGAGKDPAGLVFEFRTSVHTTCVYFSQLPARTPACFLSAALRSFCRRT